MRSKMFWTADWTLDKCIVADGEYMERKWVLYVLPLFSKILKHVVIL